MNRSDTRRRELVYSDPVGIPAIFGVGSRADLPAVRIPDVLPRRIYLVVTPCVNAGRMSAISMN